MPILPKVIYRLNVIPIKDPNGIFIDTYNFLTEMGKMIVKLYGTTNTHTHTQSQIHLVKQSRRYHTPGFQNILQRYSNKNSMILALQIHRPRNTVPKNRPMHILSIVARMPRTHNEGRVLGKLPIYMQKNKPITYLLPYTKIYLNIRPESVKLLEGNIREKLHVMGRGHSWI